MKIRRGMIKLSEEDMDYLINVIKIKKENK